MLLLEMYSHYIYGKLMLSAFETYKMYIYSIIKYLQSHQNTFRM